MASRQDIESEAEPVTEENEAALAHRAQLFKPPEIPAEEMKEGQWEHYGRGKKDKKSKKRKQDKKNKQGKKGKKGKKAKKGKKGKNAY